MSLSDFKRYWIDGEPRCRPVGRFLEITAAHRLPSSSFELIIAIWLVGTIGALVTLIQHYAPETGFGPETNILLAAAAMNLMAIGNAAEALVAVAGSDPEAVPLEALRGWMFASYWIVGTFLFQASGLFDVYTWLFNREHITLGINDERISVRHGIFRFPKRIALDQIEDVLIFANHRTGHDVMLQHTGGLMRLASVHGDLTRPTLIKLCVERALSERRQRSGRRVPSLPAQAAVSWPDQRNMRGEA